MPVKTGGGLVKVSYLITQRQYDRMHELWEAKQREGQVVKKTDTAREVIEAGLDVLFSAGDTASGATVSMATEAA